MRGWSVALALMLALSGCFGGDEEPVDGTDDDDHGNGPGGNGNETGNQTNAPPRLAFFADNNTIPLEEPAVFNLNVSDDDGDFIDFTIDADGDGESDTVGSLAPADGAYEPFNFTYSYTSAGLYNATLNLTDGVHTLERVIVINVTEADDGGPELAPFEAIAQDEDVVLPCTQCTVQGAAASFSWNSGSAGIDAAWIELPPEAAGYPFEVSSTGGDPDALFLDSCSTGASEMGSHGAAGPETGTVPTGAGCLMAWEFADVLSTITFKVG